MDFELLEGIVEMDEIYFSISNRQIIKKSLDQAIGSKLSIQNALCTDIRRS
ncbi:hypothetical protein KGR20_18805 [Cytobacillus oceanisediminis]|uniref:Uncharacterized protein n=1 Tax=Niallia alba TaxID=2729105 RepID=A0A7Y0K828_9BACI|nr:hypothetical protein [Cytobacillus oceanisediminis]NMO77562.1 hypothetical protein [Niallia alba]